MPLTGQMDLISRIEAILAATAEAMGFELVRIRYGYGDRSSRPRRLRLQTNAVQEQAVEILRRRRLSFRRIAAQTGLSRATVARIGKRKGLSRLAALDPGPPIIRYEKDNPGDMIHIGIKKPGRIEGVGHRITGGRKGQSNPRGRKQGGGVSAPRRR